jgi:hypothetical protein
MIFPANTTSTKDTIAVIAFEPWSSRTKPHHVATQLSVASLATATIASMIQKLMALERVVVACGIPYVQDEEYANDS